MTDGVKEGYGWSQEISISLHEKIKKDLKKAMLQKDPEVRNTMRLIMAEFPKLTVPITLESGKKSTRLKTKEEITNDDIIGIIQGLAKSERMVLEAKARSGFLGFGRKVEVKAFCSKHLVDVPEPHIGCPVCAREKPGFKELFGE